MPDELVQQIVDCAREKWPDATAVCISYDGMVIWSELSGPGIVNELSVSVHASGPFGARANGIKRAPTLAALLAKLKET